VPTLKTHAYLRKLMALPYLPQEQVGPVFRKLSAEAGSEKLKELCQYINDTWFEGASNCLLNRPYWPILHNYHRAVVAKFLANGRS
jgi:hypothetical protein